MTGPTGSSRAPSTTTTHPPRDWPSTRARAGDRKWPALRISADRRAWRSCRTGPMVLYGLQHVMSMYAGVVAVPFIVGSTLKLPFADLSYLLAATLLVSGLATLLQTLGVPWIGA